MGWMYESKPHFMFTLRLDLTNGNPDTWGTYMNDAAGMTPGSDDFDKAFGIYPCVVKDGVEQCRLKRNDFSKMENGSAAPITTLGSDVMTFFPRMGYYIYETGNYLIINLTDAPITSGNQIWYFPAFNTQDSEGKNSIKRRGFYYGAYQGYVTNNKLYSTSGKAATANITLANARTYATNRGSGYGISSYYLDTFIKVLYLMKYRGKNAKTVIGKGNTDNTATFDSGYTNAKGMDWGESTGKYPMKVFGIENFYGNNRVMVDGCLLNTNGHILVSRYPTLNDTGSGYEDLGEFANFNNYLKIPYNDNSFLPLTSQGATASTYFCSKNVIPRSTVMRYACCSGSYIETEANMFSFFMGNDINSVGATRVARLVYYPESGIF